MSGFIILHRKIKESGIYSDSQAVHLWVHLLLTANHKPACIQAGNQMIDIKRGQFLTGRKKLSDATGITESKIQRLLKLFEKCHMIEQQTFTKYRLISIVNYDCYQSNEQQTNSKRTASEQQVNTNNNDNNDNKLNTMSVVTDLPTRETIPYQQIVDSYHENCVDMPRVQILTDKRKRKIKTFWNKNDTHRDIDFYNRYFAHAQSLDFLTGRVQVSGDRQKPWIANLEWLVDIDNLAKIIEGKYDNG